jgi:hypothetical protein
VVGSATSIDRAPSLPPSERTVAIPTREIKVLYCQVEAAAAPATHAWPHSR